MSETLKDVAVKARKLGQAHDYLRKVEKIFTELHVGTQQTEKELLDLLEFCNARCMELGEGA